MTDPRWTDPLRLIVHVEEASGCDTLTFECGHKAVKDHRPRWGKRSACHGCRVWRNNDDLTTTGASS